MKSYSLSFGTITIINKKLAEVIINDGVIIDEIMVDEYHDFLLSALQPPFSLIINKKHSYCLNFNAQRTILSLKEIKDIAVVIGSVGALMSTETLININSDKNWNIDLFHSRDEALDWLAKQ
ncbi:hypothetical protein ACFFU9_03240 [Mariniflexile ostreae]|uniref:SpoIIAA-like protein n=1 Tax=Mariniflexile ostreae TaxID=1520892 RepID=A0ABV5F8G9_9FLAO